MICHTVIIYQVFNISALQGVTTYIIYLYQLQNIQYASKYHLTEFSLINTIQNIKYTSEYSLRNIKSTPKYLQTGIFNILLNKYDSECLIRDLYTSKYLGIT